MRRGQIFRLAVLALALLGSPLLRAQTLPPEVAQQGYAD